MSPYPWKFHASLYGHAHVVADAERRIIASHVPRDDGVTIAAAPTLLEFVRATAQRSDDVGAEARAALEKVGLDAPKRT